MRSNYGESCALCRFSDRAHADKSGATLICYRYPPQIIPLSHTEERPVQTAAWLEPNRTERVEINGPAYFFPVVFPETWCGEFKPNEKAEK